MFLGVVWVPIISLWLKLIPLSSSFTQGLLMSANLFYLALFDLTTTETLYTLLVSVLVGMNISLLTFYFKTRRSAPTGTASSGLIGIIATILGFGCASCGTLFISLLLANIGGVGFILTPFLNGYVLQSVGIFLLVISTYMLWKKVNDPLVCPVE